MTPAPSRRRSNAWDQALKRESEGKSPKRMVENGRTEFERRVQAAGGNIEHPAVREWVRKNHGRHWVPTDVLASCGIQAEEFA